MRFSKSAAIVLFFLFCGFAPEGSACSVSFLEAGGQALVARNMDWPDPAGLVAKNVKGLEKTALLPPAGATPYTWTSTYGSITFDMVAAVPGFGEVEAPGCGMNEAGFYAAALFVNDPDYPGPGGHPALRCAEVVRVLLDTCATVPEALDKFNEFGVTEFVVGEQAYTLHWFLADKNGSCAIVEFPPDNSQTISIHYPGHKCMTNNYYELSYTILAEYQGFGGTKPIPSDETKRTSDIRFVRNVYFSGEVLAKASISKDDAFFVMEKVKQTEGTRGSQSKTDWTIVYDLKGLGLSWTAINNSSQRSIDLARVDFSTSRTVDPVDIQSSGSGDVTAAFGEKPRETSSGGCAIGGASIASLPLLLPLLLLEIRK